MNRIFGVLGSIKPALVLITLLLLLSALATLIPQDATEEVCRARYSAPLAGIILSLHLYRFFRSAVFLVPLGLFFINLCACSLRRVIRRAAADVPRRYGPDIIHLSLLLLIILGVLSLFLTSRGVVSLGRGESFILPGGPEVQVTDARYLTYEDGRPKDWFTALRVVGEEGYRKEHTLEVNKPLSLGVYRIYQYDFSQEAEAVLKNAEGFEGTVRLGEGFRVGDGVYRFLAVEEGEGGEGGRAAVFSLDRGSGLEVVKLSEGLGTPDFRLEEIPVYSRTGLLVTRNPLFPFILIALLIFAAGMTLTFFQKIRDIEGVSPQ
ncbi:MAG: cytochrome c biogenesis protein ResB [Spirochaetales bacterium]|nr:cytochrome c biogenesis protein ResB [Spirochaetales bacterium]